MRLTSFSPTSGYPSLYQYVCLVRAVQDGIVVKGYSLYTLAAPTCHSPDPPRRADGRGRPWRDPRDVLNGILWIMRTGAPWRDTPERYPPYQTCHRRFQRWTEDGVLDEILRALAEDLKDRGDLDLSECFVDGTFVGAKKGEDRWERPSGAKA
jgi:transposase